MNEPKPHINADGVPLCSNECPHFSVVVHSVHHKPAPFCELTKTFAFTTLPCLPAVVAMAARMKELEAELREYRNANGNPDPNYVAYVAECNSALTDNDSQIGAERMNEPASNNDRPKDVNGDPVERDVWYWAANHFGGLLGVGKFKTVFSCEWAWVSGGASYRPDSFALFERAVLPSDHFTRLRSETCAKAIKD